MKLCTIPYGGQDNSCGVNGSCAPLKFCKKLFGMGFGLGFGTGLITGLGIGIGIGSGMEGRSRSMIPQRPKNGCCFCKSYRNN